MLKKEDTLLKNKPLTVYSLYDEYAGMLLGYLIGVVKNKAIAEDYLVKTFSSLAKNFNNINWDEASKWCHLQRIAKNELLAYYENPNKHELFTNSQNQYLDKMTEDQQLVFNYFYFHKKTVSQLCEEINTSEDLVKKLLKEAFSIIRKSHER
ncbi:MAG: sigma-70 family RNA polymerase sigma factor [Bacteroidota bacterium]